MNIEKMIDPEFKQFVDLSPSEREARDELNTYLKNGDSKALRSLIEKQRCEYNRQPSKAKPSFPGIGVESRLIAGPADNPELALTLYTPAKRDMKNRLPVLLYFHGGGFFTDSADDVICSNIAEQVGCVVVSVSYRLAPEHPYPAAVEDCYAALLWLERSANSLGIDQYRIAVGGHSAGGCLAAAVTLMARDRGGPELIYQMLIYPALDNRLLTYSGLPWVSPKLLNREHILACWQAYLGKDHDGEVSPYAAPAREENLSGLPSAYILVADLDSVRDGAVDYSLRLNQSGVSSELHIYSGAIHAFDVISRDAVLSQRAIDNYIGALRSAFENAIKCNPM